MNLLFSAAPHLLLTDLEPSYYQDYQDWRRQLNATYVWAEIRDGHGVRGIQVLFRYGRPTHQQHQPNKLPWLWQDKPADNKETRGLPFVAKGQPPSSMFV